MYISSEYSLQEHHSDRSRFKGLGEDSECYLFISIICSSVQDFDQRNMKLLIALCILATIANASAASAPQVIFDGPTYELKPIEDADDSNAMNAEMGAEGDATELPPLRHRRVTCDVLSWQSQWLSINHSACAIRCLAQRRKGGSCRDGVCICRN
ncbi:defensin 2 [Andrena cerasifolii]|uniref:defensin 2 n=1 Tax=Andrena cerasifolii TaxID=2819439 RepID=UPI00403786AC